MRHAASFVVFSLLALPITGCGGSAPAPPAPPQTQTAPAAPAAPQSEAPPPAQPPPAQPPSAQPQASGPAAPAAPPPPPSPCPSGTILVKGGSFKMGPLKRDVTVGDFCADKSEVTAAQYEACVKAGKCSDFQLKCAEAATYQVPGKESHPIVCIDFPQAKSICEFRGMRLPTENEWEWAARGGADDRKYAWGNDAPKDQACWSGGAEGTRKGPCAVGSFPSGTSKDGLVDVTGNVFEWTSSSADGTDQMFVVRGGSWRDGVSALLWNGRPGGFKPTYRCGFGGVRCVAPPGGAASAAPPPK